MSNRSRGMAVERLAQKELESQGYLVQRAPPSYRWNKQTDLFGLFDIIALKELLTVDLGKDREYKRSVQRRYIQVKTNRRMYNADKIPLQIFKDTYCDASDSVEWWCYWKRGKRKNKHGWEKIAL